MIVSICGSSAESDIKSNCNPPGTDYILINECLINWEDWVTTKNDTDKNHSIRNDSDDDSPSNSKTSGIIKIITDEPTLEDALDFDKCEHTIWQIL